MGILFYQSGVVSSSDCQPCFGCAESSSSPCRWEDAAADSVALVARSESRLYPLGLRQKQLYMIKLYGSKNFVPAAAKRLAMEKSGFWPRAVGNGELEHSGEGDAGGRILTQYRRKQEENIADKDGRSNAGAEESDDDADTVAATRAGEVSTSTNEVLDTSNPAFGDNWSISAWQNPRDLEDGLSTLDDQFLRRIAAAENADAALSIINERGSQRGDIISNGECSEVILAAIAQNNVDLAFSILNAMRSSHLQRLIDLQEDVNRKRGRDWVPRWPQPDVTTYVALVRGLAACLRVSDAIQTVANVRRRGVPQGDEVPFGKVVNCPTCKTSLAVVQPQYGVQLVPCATCRYHYELMSGAVVSSESESISSNTPLWEKALQVLPFGKRRIPAAVHSVVVQAPDGLAQTHRFATESADVPAQEGERVTIVLACPRNVGRRVGPIQLNARPPGWRLGEPMAITNHVTGQILSLIRAPSRAGKGAAVDTSLIVSIALLLASTDAASGLLDPAFPRLIAVAAGASLTLGVAANIFLLPTLNQLPQRTVDAIAFRQRLLAQYEQMQTKLQELTQAASNEVRMLARMCQLQNKMEAVGEAAYSARIERVRKARKGLDERLAARLELMDSYAKVASMIEIEVEMDIDVLAAEAAGPDANIAEQIQRLMEVESLQKEWKNQAEANDELERLLRSAATLPDSA